ncbi:MAG: radical SAM protein [Candidatus Omnitrophica bacterium]|nr:radical SAM protein [Candidatus Omnitrophota bacterium]
MAESSAITRKRLLEREQGTFFKIGADVNIGLIYPNTYHVAMSNLGFQTAYARFNNEESCSCERFFLTDPIKPRSLEHDRFLGDFPFLGASIAYELDYIPFLKMLKAGGIPIFREERDDRHPIIFVGGFVTFFNFRPLIPFVDFFVTGEADELFGELFRIFRRWLSHPASSRKKKVLLEELAGLAGIFVPGLSKKPAILHVNNLDRFETSSVVVTPDTEFSNMFLIEIGRGCRRKCSFCVTGSSCGVLRARSLDSIAGTIGKGLKRARRIGLIAPSPADHPDIEAIAEMLVREKAYFSLSSLRIDSLSDRLLDYLAQGGEEQITLAPESGSRKLRRLIHKDFDEASLGRVLRKARDAGIKRVKLYLMTGFPGEDEVDLKDTIEMVKEAASFVEIRASVNPFIAKPGTPLEKENVEDKKSLEKKINFLRRGLSGLPHIRARFEGVREAFLQQRLAKGDSDELLDLARRLSDQR